MTDSYWFVYGPGGWKDIIAKMIPIKTPTSQNVLDFNRNIGNSKLRLSGTCTDVKYTCEEHHLSAI